ncbi:rhodanese-like domain-containing protein [Olivibacter sp. SDN3]|nr:rhodanese-like domain-containing protein [Olivibacter sp. SDN3]
MFGLFKDKLADTENDRLADEIKNGAFLVDVRTPQEFSDGSVKNAVNIPLNELETSLHNFKGKGAIVVFCQSGNRSGSAKRILEKHGFQQVFNGGGWRSLNKLVNSIK